jgi:ubiquinone biosynthesis protein
MSTQPFVFNLLFRPIISWAAHRTLVGRNRTPSNLERGRFTRADVDGLLDQSWHRFDELGPDISREPTLGSRLNVRLAALTLAMLHSLTAVGIDRNYAIQLIGDTCWQVYQYWGYVGLLLGRLSGRHPIKDHARRVIQDGSWPMSFPFNPPGYRARYVPTPGGLGFNVIRCPVAEYFHAQGAADLAVGTWCMLDYPLAEMLNMNLIRGQTLAAGQAHCDFRWFADPGHSSKGAVS